MAISKQSIAASAKLDRVKQQYECYDHQHAIAILTLDYPELLAEICDVLLQFRLTIEQIKRAGGKPNDASEVFADLVLPLGWTRRQMTERLVVDGAIVVSTTHIVDFAKDGVAFVLDRHAKRRQERQLETLGAFQANGKLGVGVVVGQCKRLTRTIRLLNEGRIWNLSESSSGSHPMPVSAEGPKAHPVAVFGV